MTKEEAEKIAKLIETVLSIEVGALQWELCDRLSEAKLGWKWRYHEDVEAAGEDCDKIWVEPD